MLHLFGYDHIEAEDAAIMEPKQEEILNAMHLTREEA
jgi:probable rRNA maturation factor